MKKYVLIIMFVVLMGIGIEDCYAVSGGTYKIVSALDETKVLTSSDDGNIEISTDEDADNQLWDIKEQSDGTYIITSKVDSNKSFDVDCGSTQNGTNVRLYNTNNTAAQKWTFKEANGYYYIVSNLPGLHVLDIAWGKKNDGTNVWLYEANYSNAQKFKFIEKIEGSKSIEDGTYYINPKGNTALSLASSKIEAKSNIETRNKMYSYEEAYNIKYLENGYYEISSYKDDDILLTVDGNKGNNWVNIILDSRSEEDNNKWIIKENADNTYSFVSKLDNYYLDISGGSKKALANIQLYEGNGTTAQRFYLNKVDFSKIEEGIYEIESYVKEDIVLSANNEIINNNTNIVLESKSNSNKEKWKITNIEDNIYEIKSGIDEKYVFDIENGSSANYANIRMYKTNSTSAQRWRIVKENDYYRIINAGNGKSIDAAWGHILSGTNIWLYEDNGTNAQKFKIKEAALSEYERVIEDDKYIIYSALNLNKSLRYNSEVYLYGVEGEEKEIISFEYVDKGFYVLKNKEKAYTNKNGKVVMEDYNGSDNQLWFIRKEGEYYTFISKTDGKVMDMVWGSSADNTKVQTYESNGTNAQKFYLEAVLDNDITTGYYRISSNDLSFGITTETAYNGSKVTAFSGASDKQVWYFEKSGNIYTVKYGINPNRVFDVTGGSVKDGTEIQTYSSNNTKAQKWHIIHLKDGTYKLIGNGSHLILSLVDGSAKIYSMDNNKIQSFALIQTEGVSSYDNSVANGYYTISSVLNDKKVLDVSGANPRAGTNVQLYSSNSTLAQAWKFRYVDNGMYEIISALNSKMALTNYDGNVQINKYTGSENQKWYIKMLDNDQISIISAKDSLFIDVYCGGTSDGTNIGMYTSNNTNSQRFVLNVYGENKTYRGLDVSAHQFNIDWNSVASSGLHFALIRIGYGIYQDQKDKYFEANYAGASSHDIPIGLYTYGYALNVDEARTEAYLTLQWLNGREIELPIFYDMEDADGYKARYGMPSNETLTQICDTFCDIITQNGYQCGIYAGKNWLENKLDAAYLASKYQIWVAHWTGPDDYETAAYHQTPYNKTPYNFWQFSSAGSYNGISGNVDLDYGYNIFD